MKRSPDQPADFHPGARPSRGFGRDHAARSSRFPPEFSPVAAALAFDNRQTTIWPNELHCGFVRRTGACGELPWLRPREKNFGQNEANHGFLYVESRGWGGFPPIQHSGGSGLAGPRARPSAQNLYADDGGSGLCRACGSSRLGDFNREGLGGFKEGEWCCETGLNCRPLHYQWSALPLSYHSTAIPADACAPKRPSATRGRRVQGIMP